VGYTYIEIRSTILRVTLRQHRSQTHVAVLTHIPVVGRPELRYGPDAGTGVGPVRRAPRDCEGRPRGRVDRVEELSSLLDGELGGLAFGESGVLYQRELHAHVEKITLLRSRTCRPPV
jgi:hypothetical protein